ncbi:MAG: class I SAM-dependent methyltransferase [Chitinophagaceae bacterium]
MKKLLYIIYCSCSGIHSMSRPFLKKAIKGFTKRPKVLDVGGRKSPYTVGLPIDLTISDIPRETNIQSQLNLGFTDTITAQLKARDNVKEVVYDDMTKTNLAPGSFDGVITIEVIEHVPEDEKFVANISKVLKSGGFLILSTPNGDHVINDTNPDHIRHYRKAELEALLQKYFSKVTVYYAVPDTWFHSKSHYSLKKTKPFRAMLSITSGIISGIHSRMTYKNSNVNKEHLFATCIK